MKHTKDSLIKLLQDEYHKTGIIPSYNNNRAVHTRVFAYHFGSWGIALQAANIPKKKKEKLFVIQKIAIMLSVKKRLLQKIQNRNVVPLHAQTKTEVFWNLT